MGTNGQNADYPVESAGLQGKRPIGQTGNGQVDNCIHAPEGYDPFNQDPPGVPIPYVCSECWDYQEACYGLPDSEEELERWQAEGTPPEDDPINQPEDFKNLRPSEQHALLDWIEDNLAPGKKASESSYSLKHYFERATGIYITNGQFKGAMQMAGYEPLDRDALNWHYKLDKSAPEGERRP